MNINEIPRRTKAVYNMSYIIIYINRVYTHTHTYTHRVDDHDDTTAVVSLIVCGDHA